MIKFNQITKKFDSDIFSKSFIALDDLSFELKAGEVCGFLGANGAGKTTSMKILLKFIRQTSGEVIIDSILGSSHKSFLQNIGYLPERPYFYPHLTGREFCHFMGSLYGMTKNDCKDAIQKWSRIFQIEFALDRILRKYSKGMLQRIGFMTAIIHNPKLIILDEPLSGVDPLGRKELKDIISQLGNEGKTVFFSSHIVADMEEVCSSVVCIEKGKLVYEGSVDELIELNSSSKINVVSKDTSSDLCSEEVEQANLNQYLSKLISENKHIISVSRDRLTLEEVFYKVKIKK